MRRASSFTPAEDPSFGDGGGGGVSGVHKTELPWHLSTEAQALIRESHFSAAVICYAKFHYLGKRGS